MMNEPSGCSDLSWTDSTGSQVTRYGRQLADRRSRAKIREWSRFGLVVGWALFLGGAFGYYCLRLVPDAVFVGCMVVGTMVSGVAIVLPQMLSGVSHLWLRLANWQGWLIMTAFLTILYFVVFWPAGSWQRWRRGSRPFYHWDDSLPAELVGWEGLENTASEATVSQGERNRSLVAIFGATLALFVQRRNFVAVPVIILLLVLGLVFYFVQTSALAPFIYTLF